jgi:hypothetical protein
MFTRKIVIPLVQSPCEGTGASDPPLVAQPFVLVLILEGDVLLGSSPRNNPLSRVTRGTAIQAWLDPRTSCALGFLFRRWGLQPPRTPRKAQRALAPEAVLSFSCFHLLIVKAPGIGALAPTFRAGKHRASAPEETFLFAHYFGHLITHFITTKHPN